MTETEELFSWEGDVCRDMVIYRFIELSIAALATAFERDTELRDKYALWLSRKNDETKPIVLYTFEVERGDSVNIFAMPQENQFFIQFQSSSFETSVSIVYDIDLMDIRAARVVMFSGKALYAVSWAEALHAAWDDELLALMRSKGDDA
ncbi:MAG: hypothetical protein ACI4TE_00350 [Alphaproteobacteria bacterium]